MFNMQYDTVLYIASFLYSLNDYKNMMLINKEIYSYLDNFEYKRIRLMQEMNNLYIKYNAIEDKNDDDLYYPSSFYNPWNIYNCINSNCPSKNVSVGVVHTYSVNKDDYEIYNENSRYIEVIAKNTHSIRRYIPYCEDCMEKYINSVQSNNFIIPISYSETLLLSN